MSGLRRSVNTVFRDRFPEREKGTCRDLPLGSTRCFRIVLMIVYYFLLYLTSDVQLMDISVLHFLRIKNNSISFISLFFVICCFLSACLSVKHNIRLLDFVWQSIVINHDVVYYAVYSTTSVPNYRCISFESEFPGHTQR